MVPIIFLSSQITHSVKDIFKEVVGEAQNLYELIHSAQIERFLPNRKKLRPGGHCGVSSLIAHAVSICTSGEQSQRSRKTQQEVSNRPCYLPCRYPSQARCSSSFLFSLIHPHARLLFPLLYLLLPVPSFPDILPSPGFLCRPPFSSAVKVVSLGLLSRGGDSPNQFLMCSALIVSPLAISPDLWANHRFPSSSIKRHLRPLGFDELIF